MSSKLTEIGSLKLGNFIIIDGVVCKVTDTKTSKTGKHGHAKVRLSAAGALDKRRREMIKPADAKVEVPLIEKSDAQVISISGDSSQVMDLKSYETFDISIPEELKSKIKEGSQILYWDIMGTKQMKQVKG